MFATASIGVAMGTPGYTRPEELLRDADTAMYRAKDMGRATHAVFHPSMHAHARAQLQLETDLRRAIERSELRLRYQPIVSLSNGHVSGCEALIVWEHPSRGEIPPNDFIPSAEDTGLIVPLGRWALQQACRDAKAWNDALQRPQTASVSVNLSGKQMSSKPNREWASDAAGITPMTLTFSPSNLNVRPMMLVSPPKRRNRSP